MSISTQERIETVTVTIANTGTTSTAVDCIGKTFVGIEMPQVMTGATLSIQISVDGTNYYPLYNSSGNLVTITKAAAPGSKYLIGLAAEDFFLARKFKLVSASAEGAERTFKCVLRIM